MNIKAKRPALFDLNNLLVKPSATTVPAESLPVPVEPAPAVAKPRSTAAKAEPPAPDMFRTSVYFSRPVHDKLREIAFEERKTITDLINEGLDHVLASRNYASTAELRGKKR